MRSVETHVHFLSFGWTHEELWLRVSRKSVVAVPMEAAPRARSCRVRGLSTLTGCASLKHILSILSGESCWRENSFIQISSVHRSFEVPLVPLISNLNSSTSNFYLPIIYAQCIDELKLLSLRALNQSRSSPRSQAAKFRIEKDPRRSWCHQYSRPFF
jgi:hypothetical protein